MAFFDFLKQKEFAEITCLKKDLEISANKEQELNQKIEELKKECESLSKFKEIANLDNKKDEILSKIRLEEEHAEKARENYQSEIAQLKSEIDKLSEEIQSKKGEIVELDETILLQEFGMYSPIYDFANSEMYKDRLDAVRTEQKNMILYKTAATCSETWTVNGSEAQGRVMTNQNIKQILRCFNDECDMLISKVKFNNIAAFIEKMQKSYEALNKMNSKNAVSISYEYLSLKVGSINS